MVKYRINVEIMKYHPGEEIDSDILGNEIGKENVPKWAELKHITLIDNQIDISADLNHDGVKDEKDVSLAKKIVKEASVIKAKLKKK